MPKKKLPLAQWTSIMRKVENDLQKKEKENKNYKRDKRKETNDEEE